MDIGLEELRLLGGMRIMAGPAVHDRGVDVQMRLRKIPPLGIVAFNTQGLDGLVQQRILGGEMRLVASLAISRGRLMSPFLLHSRFHVLVAGQTDVGALGKKNAFQVRLVWIMARRAVSGFDRLVLTFRSFGFCLQLGVT